MISVVIAFVSYKISSVLDIKRKITKLLIGLPVYDKRGKWIGKVEAVSQAKKSIEFKNNKTKAKTAVAKGKFILKKGRILLSG